jgi:hypothetical protein
MVVNYKCNDCPISTIEDKLGTRSTMDIINSFTVMDGKNKDRSLVTLEWLWIAIMLTVIKIFGLIIYKMIKQSIMNIKCKK